jgi:hypothetical protein
MSNWIKSFSILFQISEEDSRLKNKSDFRAGRLGSCRPNLKKAKLQLESNLLTIGEKYEKSTDYNDIVVGIIPCNRMRGK